QIAVRVEGAAERGGFGVDGAMAMDPGGRPVIVHFSRRGFDKAKAEVPLGADAVQAGFIVEQREEKRSMKMQGEAGQAVWRRAEEGGGITGGLAEQIVAFGGGAGREEKVEPKLL